MKSIKLVQFCIKSVLVVRKTKFAHYFDLLASILPIQIGSQFCLKFWEC